MTLLAPGRARPELHELTREQMQPLELLVASDWPETWRDLARSHYVTLRWLQGDQVPPGELAALAVALAKGIGQDMGGEQPYIPLGEYATSNVRVRRIVDALNRGERHQVVAAREGISTRRVQQIEAAWRREQIAQRQGVLPL